MSDASVARASAWMALGTILSRVTGFARLLLIAAAIGLYLNADLFNNANTIPNALYILVAGGIFNVVLVPQLVRAMKTDEDGGDAYAQRVITLGLMVLGVATVLLVLLVPLLMRVVFDAELFTPDKTAARDSAAMLMRICMPQVFFYGAFVLVGQVLNARGRFGPMMWAPIVNNVVACASLGLYIVVFGASAGTDGFSTSEVWLLGGGATLGIVAQAAVLVPYLRAAGFTYRPRFDFRGVGLGHTLRLGAWTLLFILANQVAYIVVQRLGTRGTLTGADTGQAAGGTAVYEIGFLISQLPHGVITVSLATAIIPTLSALAHERRYDRMRLELARTMRVALVVIVPLATATACLGRDGAGVLRVLSNLDRSASIVGATISCFALAMVAFTVHYLVLRGFYADEDTRTPFFLQLVIAVTNIVLAVVLTHQVEPAHVPAALALSFGIAYLVGAAVSSTMLSRRIGSLLDAEMVRFVVRLVLAAGVAAVVMLLLSWWLGSLVGHSAGASLLIVLVGGGLGAAAFVGAALAMRLSELTYLVSSLRRR